MEQFSQQDHHFMARAIKLAKRGHYTTSPNPRVGCVLVNNSIIVGEGFHQQAGQGHAEVNALALAGIQAKGATAYVTLEPCAHFGKTPPCAQALIDAGVTKVIAAMVDPNPQVAGKGLAMLEQAGINTAYGLLTSDAEALNKGFLHLMRYQRPYVRCKLAASLDGQTAMKTGESQWITSKQARADVQQLRAQSCAIICGATSVINDNARMNVRYQEFNSSIINNYPPEYFRQPIRVVLDNHNQVTPDLALFAIESPIILLRHRIEKSVCWPHFVKQVAVKRVNGKLALNEVLNYLANLGLNDVLIESGASLAGAFIEQDLVDELILYQAPKLMGSDGKGLCNLPTITSLKQAKTLKIKTLTFVGDDIKIVAQFNKKS